MASNVNSLQNDPTKERTKVCNAIALIGIAWCKEYNKKIIRKLWYDQTGHLCFGRCVPIVPGLGVSALSIRVSTATSPSPLQPAQTGIRVFLAHKPLQDNSHWL